MRVKRHALLRYAEINIFINKLEYTLQGYLKWILIGRLPLFLTDEWSVKRNSKEFGSEDCFQILKSGFSEPEIFLFSCENSFYFIIFGTVAMNLN